MTVTSSVPPFVVESVELPFPGDFVESSEFACMRGELPAFSELFCGSDVVVDFPNPPPNSLPIFPKNMKSEELPPKNKPKKVPFGCLS
ncbi:MAG: hypothetical protein LBU34_00400 [Planctomycetaceae bacterium]|nr:hypothetical protein [Planctomycetaceae bacterium]